MKLSIVVPAYNEERGVQDILRRCTAFAGRAREAGLDGIEVILVDDGSRDQTLALARQVPGVLVVSHPVNRGYGAAIKTGFERATGDLLGFLDADGTCDPAFFGELVRLLRSQDLDVALGSRLHPGSRMPFLRVVGNRIFRALVNLFGSSSVSDVASGMRVLRRSALPRLYPLPDGLDFTPAMSVRAVMDKRMRIGETPMPYHERIGSSKLSVIADGLRFLGIILETAVTFRPLLFFGAGAAAAAVLGLLGLAFAWGGPAAPLPYYLEHRRLEDWMIFRVALTTLLLSISAFLAALGAVARAFTTIINEVQDDDGWGAKVQRILAGRFFLWGGASLALSFVVNRRLLASYFRTGHIPDEFWVFPVVGSLFALVGVELIAFGLVMRIARLLRAREAGRSDGAADRPRQA